MSISITTNAHAPAGAAAEAPIDPKLQSACRQFEGQFFNMMLQEMRKTVPDDTLLGDDSHEQEIFQGMMDDNIAQEMAKRSYGANDLAEQMYRQLARSGGANAASEGTRQADALTASLAASKIRTNTEETENGQE
jgi:flagellar protein FlgJ